MQKCTLCCALMPILFNSFSRDLASHLLLAYLNGASVNPHLLAQNASRLPIWIKYRIIVTVRSMTFINNEQNVERHSSVARRPFNKSNYETIRSMCHTIIVIYIRLELKLNDSLLLVRLDEKCNLINLMMVSWWLNTHTFVIINFAIINRIWHVHTTSNAHYRNMELFFELNQSLDFVYVICDVGVWTLKISNIEHCQNHFGKMYVYSYKAD